MPLQTVPIFVSSTWLDLGPEREAVEAAIQRLREMKFVGMEYFGSRDETTRRTSLDEVDQSLVYVGIFAARYGSGITEEEYRRARELGLPCFIYFKDDATIQDKWRETDPAQTAKLDALKQELRTNHIICPDFTSPDDLAAKVTADLHNWLFDEYLTPILERAARGEVPFAQAQALLSGVKDRSALSPALLAQLTARHQLRAPVGDFVGREKEIDELLATLRGGGSAAITGISGMGGIGKTELSLYVAHRLRDAYPDAQLVLDMRGTADAPRDPSDALASCIRAFLGLEQRLPDDVEELTHLYRSVLEGKRALILLDHASDGAQVRPMLPPAGSSLLITSRNALTLPGMTRVTLDQLSPAEARELLKGIAPRVSADTADRICYLCGYLPLAIRAAGSLLDVTVDLDPEDYATQLGDERTRLERIGTEGVDIGVEASFNLSYARLTPDAARVFRQLAVFPSSFDAEAEEGVCEDESHRHLSDLVRRSLVLYDADTGRYRLHDLMRLFADARVSEAELDLARWAHSGHYLRRLGDAQEIRVQGGEGLKRGLALFDAEWRNIQSGHDFLCARAGKHKVAALLCSSYCLVGAEVLNLRLHPREYILWLESALAAARALNQRLAEAYHLSNLCTAYYAVGDMGRAVQSCMQAAEAFNELGDYQGTAVALTGISRILVNLGSPRDAIKILGFALVTARETGARHLEGKILSNMGAAYESLGELKRAIECHEEHLAISRETGDARGEGEALRNLSSSYYALREMRRSADFAEQALEVFRAVEDRREEAAALGNLAGSLVELGEYQRAVECCEQQYIIARELGIPDEEGKALGTLGNAYTDLGDLKSAIKTFGQAASVFDRTGNRRGAAAARWNRALALYHDGERVQAIADGEAALGIYEQIESPHAEGARRTLAEWRRAEATKAE